MRKAIINKENKLEKVIAKQYKDIKTLQRRNEETKRIEAERADIVRCSLLLNECLKHSKMSRKVLCKFLGITYSQFSGCLAMNMAYPQRKKEKLELYVANLLKNKISVKEI